MHMSRPLMYLGYRGGGRGEGKQFAPNENWKINVYMLLHGIYCCMLVVFITRSSGYSVK